MKAKDLNFRLKVDLIQKFYRQCFKNGLKKASLHIYGVRSTYNIVSVCISSIHFLTEESCKGSSGSHLIKTDKPKCRVSTDFPFDDLQTSIMNISCHSSLILKNVSINETAIYTCRARIAFKTVLSPDSEDRNRRKILDIDR